MAKQYYRIRFALRENIKFTSFLNKQMRSPMLQTQPTFPFLSSSNYLYKKQIHSNVETFKLNWNSQQ